MPVGGRGVTLVWNDAEAAKLLHSPGGPVARALERRAEVATQGAKRRCPVSPDGSHGRPSGYLRSSIGWDLGLDGLGLYADIGTRASYALFPEFGTKPHVITSHGPWPLRDKHGRVFGRTVHHPGTPAEPYLRPSLDDIRSVRD